MTGGPSTASAKRFCCLIAMAATDRGCEKRFAARHALKAGPEIALLREIRIC